MAGAVADFGGKQRSIVSTLVRAIVRRFRWRVWGVVYGLIAEIRRRHLVSKESLSSIARDLKTVSFDRSQALPNPMRTDLSAP
jgi:hypothetical protein